jgi:hypothetical protein
LLDPSRASFLTKGLTTDDTTCQSNRKEESLYIIRGDVRQNAIGATKKEEGSLHDIPTENCKYAVTSSTLSISDRIASLTSFYSMSESDRSIYYYYFFFTVRYVMLLLILFIY